MTSPVLPVESHSHQRTEVRAHDLVAALEEFMSLGVKVLSLDCFDTLLWRWTATPVDVFYDLAASPAFAREGLNARVRRIWESNARSQKRLDGSNEVTISDIYRTAFPRAPEATIAELCEEELQAEERACYPFPPVVELIREAKHRGLSVIIVSDTYLPRPELERLLSRKLPAGVFQLIDRVFCSCDPGLSKPDGLFKPVVKELGVAASTILHIGDNHEADFRGAKKCGVRPLHLVHHEVQAASLLRLQSTACCVLHPAVRDREGMPSPYRGVLASRPIAPDVAWELGYSVAGPVLHAFARFILGELEQMRADGKRPRPLFLLRDAHLPREICNILAGGEVGHPVAISRFASNAASFRTQEDIDRYLVSQAGSNRFDVVMKQLLIPDDMAQDILKKVLRSEDPPKEFAKRIRRPEVTKVVTEHSRTYRERLHRYLRKTANLEAGDTLVLIDLGYEGTAQRQLEPVFREDFGYDVAGLYLLLVPTPAWNRSRKGLFDASWCDDRIFHAIVPYVALLEDICTSAEASVVDYEEDGTPVYGEQVIAHDQQERTSAVQEACRAFAAQADAFFRVAGEPPAHARRVAALATLGRLLFLPTAREMEYLRDFRLDINLATDETIALFDPEAGLSGLRRRGMFFMEHGSKGSRMNYPFELRYAGIELSLALMAQHRFMLDFSVVDLTLRNEDLEIMVARDDNPTLARATAHATHDGYFALTIPVGACEYNLGIIFGNRYEWVQLESVELIPNSALLKDRESMATISLLSHTHFENMAPRANGLFQCMPGGFAFIVPPKLAGSEHYVCRIVYRPVSPRSRGN